MQAFTEAAMREYLPTVMDVSSRTLEQWAGSTEPIKFYGAAKCFAFDVAATVLTGVRYDGDRLGVPPRKLSHPDLHTPRAHHFRLIGHCLGLEYHTCYASLWHHSLYRFSCRELRSPSLCLCSADA